MKRDGSPWNLLFSFGATLALTTVGAILGGNWLDQRWGTRPLFLILLVFLVVAANFRLLFKDLFAAAGKGGEAKPPAEDSAEEDER